jgi:hypothetical protein
MIMEWHDAALVLAGIIGCIVAVIHGVLTQRFMVRPFRKGAAPQTSAPVRRLIPLLLHFSTFNWFVSGLALLLAAYAFGGEARLATGLLVGSSYLFGAAGNLWATRGRHPGWILYGAALLLIIYGLSKPGG